MGPLCAVRLGRGEIRIILLVQIAADAHNEPGAVANGGWLILTFGSSAPRLATAASASSSGYGAAERSEPS